MPINDDGEPLAPCRCISSLDPPMLALILLSILILGSWLRVVRPPFSPVVGAVIHDARIPLLGRLRMHLVACTVVLAASVTLVIAFDTPWWLPLLALISNAGLVTLPLRYTLTTVGLRSGFVRFRRWTEFAGVSRAPGGARLLGTAGRPDMRIWLSRQRGDDEFVHLIRRSIRTAYQGRPLSPETDPEATEIGLPVEFTRSAAP